MTSKEKFIELMMQCGMKRTSICSEDNQRISSNTPKLEILRLMLKNKLKELPTSTTKEPEAERKMKTLMGFLKN